MMVIAFATCNKKNALMFLSQEVGRELAETDLPLLMELLELDAVRVLDPSYHTCQIVEGPNFKEATEEEINAAIAEVQAVMNKEEGKA
jgi:hypothetical protein